MTEVERLNDQLCDLSADRHSRYRADRIREELNNAMELAKSFSKPAGVEVVSLAVLLQAMQRKIDELEYEIIEIRRAINDE